MSLAFDNLGSQDSLASVAAFANNEIVEVQVMRRCPFMFAGSGVVYDGVMAANGPENFWHDRSSSGGFAASVPRYFRFDG